MTIFRSELGVTSRNAEDSKVLLVGIVCAMFVFSFFTVIEGHGGGAPIVHVDLVQVR